MDKFWVVTLFHFQPSASQWNDVKSLGLDVYNSLGIEEFSLDEAQVDEILGDRSYSGGDLPQEVLDEVEERVLKGPVNYRFFFSNSQDASGFHLKVKNDFLCESQVESHQSEDWNAEWKKHYSPIKVNEFLEVVPSWEEHYETKSQKKIFIYPGMGFGTGSHETTFLCLKLFTENILKTTVKEVLDFGSGSGILGLSVFKFYPEARVDFYDIDPEANKNCYQNALINHLEDHSFRLLLPEFRSKLLPVYDVVFANILEVILVEECAQLIAHTKPNGYLILSGLLKHQAQNVIDIYSKSGMKLAQHVEKGDWAALLLIRNQE